MEEKPVETISNSKERTSLRAKLDKLPWRNIFKIGLIVAIPATVGIILITFILTSLASLNPNEV